MPALRENVKRASGFNATAAANLRAFPTQCQMASSIGPASAVGIEPTDHVWPDLHSCFPAHEDAEMLQAYPDFAGIIDDAHAPRWHRVSECLTEAKGATSSAVLTTVVTAGQQ